MKSYKDYKYTLTEEEMQDLVARSKVDSVAQSELLEVFDNFLSRYTTLLYYGKWNIADYDIRKFIWLFVTDPGVRFHLLRGKLNTIGYQSVSEVLRRIVGMAQRYGEEEDIKQTVQLTFLECVMKYTPKETKPGKGIVPFQSYVYGYYLFVLKRNVEIFLIDQLGRKTFPLITDEEEVYDEGSSAEPTPGFTAPPTPSAEELLGPEEIDEYWVVGDTAMPPFNELTIQERQLLKWRFVDNYRSSEIAIRITEHPNTVREHFNRIRTKIREIVAAEVD